MRILERDKQLVYYAKYAGKEEVIKDGKRTGEYELAYTSPKMKRLYVSTVMPVGNGTSSGKASLEPYGNRSRYARTVVSETDLGLSIDDLFWIGSPALSNASGGEMWTEADLVDGGTMWEAVKAVAGGWMKPWEVEGAKPNYRIETIGQSKHHFIYGLKEI